MTAPTRRPLVPVPAKPFLLVDRIDNDLRPRLVRSNPSAHKPIGQRLVERGVLDPGDLVKSLAMQARQDARIGEILLCNRMVSETDLLAGLSEQWSAEVADFRGKPPDARLVDDVGSAWCLRHGLLPWQRNGSAVAVATTRPERFSAIRPELEEKLGPVVMALTSESELHRALTTVRNPALAARAETRVPQSYSCRGWENSANARLILAGILTCLALAVTFPVPVFLLLAAWAILTLTASVALKVTALATVILAGREKPPAMFQSCRRSDPAIARLPTVSIMVPLFREQNVADKLVKRLARLAYPKELMDILLVVEEADTVTADVLANTHLPRWMRIVTVPAGGVQTKPRALNYALDFCRGQIIGVWDAEDAPEADQLHKVVRRFHERGPDVACLQGRLDYYNARTNWLSRCFTIEYASWFGVILPGLQNLGLALPLGGTTIFFRREALERLGGWDAHNVTEDADLGMRLARLGYRTEMVETVTGEEANCRLVPWIKQRSRWLKGYALTWAVHMRAPGTLLRDLGPRKFTGFQVLFLGTLTQFLLAPVLWSFWLLAFGLPHPLTGLLPSAAYWPLMALFVLSELTNIVVGAFAVRGETHRFLMKWVPTQHFYFPLAALASYKAFYEVLTRPFFWDKTSHGHYDETEAETGILDGPEKARASLARLYGSDNLQFRPVPASNEQSP
ncbi:glycosyltransferase family 2 protein [Tropicimonas marinistellae]|uniref:glycosyltransferase family 2 protein n=1 Tax=Tropicimonas marinistellae TaxID=1739787 RepID=UPI00098ED159|nr:glycosyltransferase family 2 protein [Tropicimonas marinistellae]